MSELTVAITATNHDAAAYLARVDAGALARVIERALLEDLTARLQAERGAKHPLSDSFAVTCLRANMAERGG
jgi:hypothetical protein